MVKKKLLAVIPARSGSKRISNKNIVDFAGKPMIAWTIAAAQAAEIFDRIIVSTDDPKIAEVAKACGVEVPFLRNQYNDDFSTVSQATIYALQQTTSFFNEDYDGVIQLMANCPLRTSQDILDAYNNFTKRQSSFQISCFQFGWMNPWWAASLDSDFKPTRLFPDVIEKRSQDLEELYCPTGAIWIAKAQPLMETGSFYGQGYTMFPLSWKSAIDIDTYDDLEMARVLFQLK